MDSSGEPDIISSLPNCLLLIILSYLPFKEVLRTSLVSKRWLNLHRETTKVSFKEAEFVTGNENDDADTRKAAFMAYVTDWVSKFAGHAIESFELCFSKPFGYEAEIQSVVDFAVLSKVKNLVLDFADPRWMFTNEAQIWDGYMIELPEKFYNQTTIQKMKLSFCEFDPSLLVSPGELKNVCIRFIELKMMKSFLSKTPLLENLRIKNCWNVGLEAITGVNHRLYKLVLKDCYFSIASSSLYLPNILIFKYSGRLHHFVFVKVNKMLEEVDLDFWEQTHHNAETGTQLKRLLYKLRSAKNLTLCPFLIQMIQDTADPIQLDAPMETQQLIIKTNFQVNEFIGIKQMINSCPYLEILTFHLVGAVPLAYVPPIDPDAYWIDDTNHVCLNENLRAIEMWDFCGGTYEMHVLRFLIRNSLVLETIDLYLPNGMEETVIEKAREAAATLDAVQAGSRDMQIYIQSG